MDPEKHQKISLKIQNEVKRALSLNKKISIKRKGSSNRTYSRSSSEELMVIDTSRLNQVISFSSQKKQIWVQPGLTMEKLVAYTLKRGWVPKVVPEFKGITVGGAIQGGALESSSFKYGQFGDTCIEYEVLLGTGEILSICKESYPDLFFGLSSSYGTLALLLSIKIELIESCKKVHLSFHSFDYPHQMTAAFDSLIRDSSCCFLEGIGYAPNQWVLIAGKMTQEKGRYPIKLTERTPWYYEQIQELLEHRIDEAEIDLQNYLFRHDTGAFWMGRYLSFWKTFLLYLFQRQPKQKQFLKLVESLKQKPLKNSSGWLRFFLGSKLKSQKLYQTLHQMPQRWVQEYLMIQDCYIPLSQLNSFLKKVETKIGLFPLWLCPIQSTQTPQFFAPHLFKSKKFLINVGLYGLPNKKANAKELTLLLEKLVTQVSGKKMLYGSNFYLEKEFWTLYSQKDYQQLREKYKAEKLFCSIESKVLS